MVKKENNYYQFINGNKTLNAIELNTDLIHLLNPDNSQIRGNGGWSYTLNNEQPLGSDAITISSIQTILKDSMAFEGRSPCGAAPAQKNVLKWPNDPGQFPGKRPCVKTGL